eukprot:14942480-Alexandrium_andersonii.AAC.1
MRLQNDLKPQHAAQLWELIRDIRPMDPAGILRHMADCEFNRCNRLPEDARPEPGLVFKFLTQDTYTALPDWNWDWLFRFKESPLSNI